MSHTSTIKGIQLKDARAIEAAVADLIREGVKITLLTNTKPRMYYASQANEIGNCEYVLRLDKSRYDVGLKWDEKKGEYTAYLDTWAGEVSGQIGATCSLDDRSRQAEHAIGRFTQRYGVNAAKNAANAQGFYVEGETIDEAGNVQLVIAGM